MADPNDILLGRVPSTGALVAAQDPNAILLGRTGAAPPPAPAGDPNAVLMGQQPSAGPLDVRPAMGAIGAAANAVIPEPVKDFVGGIGGFLGKRLGAMGEVMAKPFLGDLSPEAIRGNLLKYPFFDPEERAQIESWGPSKDVPLFVRSNQPFDPLAAMKRLGALGPALTVGETPPGEPTSALELLKSRGFTEPFGPSAPQAEQINRESGGLPVGSVLRGTTTPEAAAFGLESAGVPLMNAVGRAALPLPIEAAKNVLNLEARLPSGNVFRTRAAPGVKEALEFFDPTASLPNAVREPVRNILRVREGQADLRSFIRDKALAGHAKLPVDVQDRIATAIEKRQVGGLSPEEGKVARDLVKEYATEVAARRRVGLKRFELGAHIEPLRREAMDAIDAAAHKPNSDLALYRARQSVKKLSQESGVQLPTKDLASMSTAVNDQKRFEGVAFAKRVLTKEKRVEAGAKPFGGPITPAGLSTGKMQQRLANPMRTSEEINLESIQKKGYRAFEPVVQATLKGGAANDTRVMNAGILLDAARNFGRTAAKGEKTLADIYGTTSGFAPKMQKLLERTSVPPELHEYLEKLNSHLKPDHYGPWVNSVRAVNDQFKKWALFSPGFVSRNMQNNLIQTALWGNTDLKNWEEAFHLRMKLARAKSLNDLRNVYVRTGKGGGTIRASDYLKSAISRGVIGRGQVAMETGKSFTESKLNPFRAIRAGNEFAEDTSRLAFDLFQHRQGLSPLAAAKKVDQVLFNYSPRFSSKGFQRTRRYAIPFINWASQITPLVVRSVLERPGSVGLLHSAIEKRNATQGFKPEDMQKLGKDIQDQGGIILVRGPDGVKILKPTGYGSYDANSILAPIINKDVVGMVDELASRSYPQIQVPYALLRGKDPLTGADLTGKPVPGPPALKLLFMHPVGKAWAEKHAIFQDQRDPSVIRIPDRLNILLRSIPPMRLASVLADIIKPDKKAELRAKSFVAGMSEVERNPAQQEFYRIKDTKQGIEEAIKILRRYPPAARWQVSTQFAPEVRRKLMARGMIRQ